ncbi:Uncharacterized protein TCM_043838 [Theobroma cacao]|uniref:Uncharacterized protein n=1 Tax=Theobroma cacao TaxID=3641 RepID=A0A061FWB7_THECC|nr:Uncharacterized protein TCM_043838 [Theobroma cacao]
MHIIPLSSSHMQRLMLLSLGGGRSRSIPPFTRQEMHFTPDHEATEQSLPSSSKLLGGESYFATDHTCQSTHRVKDHEASSPISYGGNNGLCALPLTHSRVSNGLYALLLAHNRVSNGLCALLLAHSRVQINM